MIVLRAVSDGATQFERGDVGEGFVEHEQVVIGQSRELQGLHAGACVRDNVPALLKYILQRSAHPVIAAGDQGQRRTFTEQLH
jgi:hypothetical protein